MMIVGTKIKMFAYYGFVLEQKKNTMTKNKKHTNLHRQFNYLSLY